VLVSAKEGKGGRGGKAGRGGRGGRGRGRGGAAAAKAGAKRKAAGDTAGNKQKQPRKGAAAAAAAADSSMWDDVGLESYVVEGTAEGDAADLGGAGLLGLNFGAQPKAAAGDAAAGSGRQRAARASKSKVGALWMGPTPLIRAHTSKLLAARGAFTVVVWHVTWPAVCLESDASAKHACKQYSQGR
jgi:hypothetical protein